MQGSSSQIPPIPIPDRDAEHHYQVYRKTILEGIRESIEPAGRAITPEDCTVKALKAVHRMFMEKFGDHQLAKANGKDWSERLFVELKNERAEYIKQKKDAKAAESAQKKAAREAKASERAAAKAAKGKEKEDSSAPMESDVGLFGDTSAAKPTLPKMVTAKSRTATKPIARAKSAPISKKKISDGGEVTLSLRVSKDDWLNMMSKSALVVSVSKS